MQYRLIVVFLLINHCCPYTPAKAQFSTTRLVTVDSGWAGNSVNAVIFRKNSLVTWQNTQFIAFYNQETYVVLGKRELGTDKWTLLQTPYKGNAADAHNAISIMVDGAGYLHMAWDHHNQPLRYCKSVAPASLTLTGMLSMTGMEEQRVTYPEFYRLKNGDLLCLYRSGESGSGNLVINHYDIKQQKWSMIHKNLIDGEGKRNAYWQAYADDEGTFHLSWVWRESPDVASNHDLCYARSTDNGKHWQTSTGEMYQLPITAATAEYACRISQQQELINQTTMSADATGNPFIATYWRDGNNAVPQYHLIFKDEGQWRNVSLDFRRTPFSLSGTGTKRIPISRPQVMVKGAGRNATVMMIFRDEERGSKASAVVIDDLRQHKWKVIDLTHTSLGSWEPTYDTELWKKSAVLNVFIQKVEQLDSEGRANIKAQPVQVLEWKPAF